MVDHRPRELLQLSTLTRVKSLAPKWTDVTRRNRWIRAYLVNAACVLASLSQIVYAHLGCPVGYSLLFHGVNDPLKVVQFGTAVSLSATLINVYGVVICFVLAKRNGQWSGGIFSHHVYAFLAVSTALCFALIVLSATTLHMALGLRINKIPWAKSSLLVSGEYVGFPMSCCNTRVVATGMKCISTAKKDRLGDLQPYLDGCHESMRRHIRSSMMILSLISLPMTIAFCWNTINIFRTVTSRPRTGQDDVDEKKAREMAARHPAETTRWNAKRRIDVMRVHDKQREDHRVERQAADKTHALISRAHEQDRLLRDEEERHQREQERVLRAPVEMDLIAEQRAWEQEASQKYQEEQGRLAEQERLVIEEQERELNALAPLMQQLRDQEQAILMDEQRQLQLLLPKTSSSLLLNKDDT